MCSKKIQTPFERVSNLKKHLIEHVGQNRTITEWLTLYDNRGKIHEIDMPKGVLSIIKYFVSSNNSLAEIQNVNLIQALNSECKIKNPSDFRDKIFKTTDLLQNAIENKLCKATSVSLITDIWTNKQNLDYIALGANCVYPNYQKELMIIGMSRMGLSHNAENIKKRIEEMMNYYKEFDKKKIHGMFYYN